MTCARPARFRAAALWLEVLEAVEARARKEEPRPPRRPTPPRPARPTAAYAQGLRTRKELLKSHCTVIGCEILLKTYYTFRHTSHNAQNILQDLQHCTQLRRA